MRALEAERPWKPKYDLLNQIIETVWNCILKHEPTLALALSAIVRTIQGATNQIKPLLVTHAPVAPPIRQ